MYDDEEISSYDEYQLAEDTGVYRPLQPSFKQAWIAALRSGDFAQGTGRLLDFKLDGSRAYCCLGVACHILGVEPVDEGGNTNTAAPNWHEHEVWQRPSAAEPDSCSPNWIQEHLANMNDDGHHTFADIADWIEANL